MPRRHLDVGVVGADALRPLEQLLCRGRRVLSQQRVRSVSQNLRKIISKLLVIVSNVSSMDTFEFCAQYFCSLISFTFSLLIMVAVAAFPLSKLLLPTRSTRNSMFQNF